MCASMVVLDGIIPMFSVLLLEVILYSVHIRLRIEYVLKYLKFLVLT